MPTTWGPDLEDKHEVAGGGAAWASSRESVRMPGNRVDDPKVAGLKKHVDRLIARVEQAPYQIEGGDETFTNGRAQRARGAFRARAITSRRLFRPNVSAR